MRANPLICAFCALVACAKAAPEPRCPPPAPAPAPADAAPTMVTWEAIELTTEQQAALDLWDQGKVEEAAGKSLGGPNASPASAAILAGLHTELGKKRNAAAEALSALPPIVVRGPIAPGTLARAVPGRVLPKVALTHVRDEPADPMAAFALLSFGIGGPGANDPRASNVPRSLREAKLTEASFDGDRPVFLYQRAGTAPFLMLEPTPTEPALVFEMDLLGPLDGKGGGSVGPVQTHDGLLVLAQGSGAQHDGSVYAFALSTGAPVWRTEASLCNTQRLVFASDVYYCAASGQPSHVNAIDAATGDRLTTITLPRDAFPSMISLRGNDLSVFTPQKVLHYRVDR